MAEAAKPAEDEPTTNRYDAGRLLSIEECEALEESTGERFEYDNGRLYAMAGARPDHIRINVRLLELLSQLSEGSCEVRGNDGAVQVASNRYYYPDASLTCDEPVFNDQYRLTNPQVVFEILSPTTHFRDRMEKLPNYLTMPSVNAVILVDSERYAVQIVARNAAGEPVLSFCTSLAESFTVPILGGTIAMRDLYRDAKEIPEEGSEEYGGV